MTIDVWAILQDALFSAFAAMGFAMLFNVPKRVLAWCMVGGALGHAIRTTTLSLFPQGLILCTLVACVMVGFFAQYCAIRFEMPATIFQITGAITMIPGVFAFQAMLGALTLAGIPIGNIADPLNHFAANLVTTGLLLGAIAFGVSAPSLLFNRIKPVI